MPELEYKLNRFLKSFMKENEMETDNYKNTKTARITKDLADKINKLRKMSGEVYIIDGKNDDENKSQSYFIYPKADFAYQVSSSTMKKYQDPSLLRSEIEDRTSPPKHRHVSYDD